MDNQQESAQCSKRQTFIALKFRRVTDQVERRKPIKTRSDSSYRSRLYDNPCGTRQQAVKKQIVKLKKECAQLRQRTKEQELQIVNLELKENQQFIIQLRNQIKLAERLQKQSTIRQYSQLYPLKLKKVQFRLNQLQREQKVEKVRLGFARDQQKELLSKWQQYKQRLRARKGSCSSQKNLARHIPPERIYKANQIRRKSIQQ